MKRETTRALLGLGGLAGGYYLIRHLVRRAVRENRCSRAVLVGHNAHFDLGFLN